jgi:hypothetical protein
MYQLKIICIRKIKHHKPPFTDQGGLGINFFMICFSGEFREIVCGYKMALRPFEFLSLEFPAVLFGEIGLVILLAVLRSPH